MSVLGISGVFLWMLANKGAAISSILAQLPVMAASILGGAIKLNLFWSGGIALM